MEAFFSPQRIVIVGASNKPGKVGYALARRALRFQGKVFFVNKRAQSIGGRECYASVWDVPGKVDLVVIAVPALFVKEVVEECGVKGVRHVVIISAGFAEARHRALQETIVARAREYGMRILGPNTFGVVNTALDLDMTFAKVAPLRGGVSCVSQSGALWSYIAEYSVEHQVGFAKFVSLGDMADVSFADMLAYLERDRATKVILVYIEYLKDGREFLRVLQQMRKPVVIVKAGKTLKGERATLSHTGSLAGSYAVYAAAFKQGGAYHAGTMREALALVKMLAWQPRLEGKRMVVVTNAGGPGVLCADALQAQGLELVALSRKLNLRLPGAWSHGNPIDVLGDAQADRYAEVLGKLARHRGFFDGVVVVVTPQEMTGVDAIAREIVRFARAVRKPVIACVMGHRSVRGAKERLEKHHIPCFHEVEDVGRVVGALVRTVSLQR